MEILKKKSVAIAFMVLCTVIGICGGSYHALDTRYQKAVKVFFHGEKGDGICIYGDLEERMRYARNMISMAEKYDVETKALSSSLALLTSSTKVNDIKEANIDLDEAFMQTYRELSQCELSAKDVEFLTDYYKSFKSRSSAISHDPYHDFAKDYNEAKDRSLLGNLLGFEDLVYFR